MRGKIGGLGGASYVVEFERIDHACGHQHRGGEPGYEVFESAMGEVGWHAVGQAPSPLSTIGPSNGFTVPAARPSALNRGLIASLSGAEPQALHPLKSRGHESVRRFWS